MTSRLADSRSPYLRAHAGNPVAWYPWGPEAFAEAARRDVPVLVSIGYSTCHWCHVMARESFSDDAIAAQLNQGFVAIKVDREEHPDVDTTYLAAAAAFTPNLGWPLTVFATPAGVPFYAGTYYPPRARPPVPGFPDVLAAVREAWTERRGEVEGTADAIAQALRAAPTPTDAAGEPPSADALATAAGLLATAEDRTFGGFVSGGSADAPKFPIATVLRFLQHRGLRAVAPFAAPLAARTVTTMAASPLRDPVEGGFFRYATRRDWSVPHYERMLTDNAQLLDAAVRADDEPVAAGIAAYLIDVLQQPSGGFGAAQDSESIIDGERSEGGYYAQDAAGRARLAPPAVDGKVVSGWNGLAIGALARAGARLGSGGVDRGGHAGGRGRHREQPASGRHARSRVARRDPLPSARVCSPTTDSSPRACLLCRSPRPSPPMLASARSLVDSCFEGDLPCARPVGATRYLRRRGSRRRPATRTGTNPRASPRSRARAWTCGCWAPAKSIGLEHPPSCRRARRRRWRARSRSGRCCPSRQAWLLLHDTSWRSPTTPTHR